MMTLVRTMLTAWTSVWRTPAMTTASLVTLVIGVGANTLVFAVVYALLLKPLPYVHAERLVQLDPIRVADGRPVDMSMQEFSDWRDRMTTLEHLALYGAEDVVLGGADEPETVRGAVVSAEFFSLLGVPTAFGRALGPGDDHTPVVVLSRRLWARRFGGDPHAIGETVLLNGRPYVVTGVAGDAFDVPAAVDLWTPLGFAATVAPPQWNMRGFRAFSAIGRLRVGASVATSQREAVATAAWLSAEYPRFNDKITATVSVMRDRAVTDVQPVLVLMATAVALVLLVAMANLAHVTLTRSWSRAREFAIRSALGADRRALVAPLIAESVVLGSIGATASLGLTLGALRVLKAVPPGGWPSLEQVRLDPPVMLVTLIVAMVTTVVAGILPALSGAKTPRLDALRQPLGGESSSARRWKRGLLTAQVAVSVILLVGGSLLTRSLLRLTKDPIGIQADGVLALTLNLASRPGPSDSRARLLEQIVADTGAVPGVTTAGVVSNLPPAASQMHTSFTVPDPVTGLDRDVSVEMISASADAFSALGVPLLAGRPFSGDDASGSRRVIILSETAARQFFPAGSAVGQSVAFGSRATEAPPPEVVGVVGDVKYSGLHAAPDGAIYMPVAQRSFERQYLVVRTAGVPLDVVPALRRAIAKVDPGIGVTDIRAMTEVVDEAAAQPRFRAGAVVVLAGMTLTLAAVGLFSLVSRMVTVQTAELGLRIALGSSRRAVVALVMRHGFLWIAPGLAVGLAGSVWANYSLRAFLFGVEPVDVMSWVVAVAVVCGLTVVATAGPAWRAVCIDPLVALKHENW